MSPCQTLQHYLSTVGFLTQDVRRFSYHSLLLSSITHLHQLTQAPGLSLSHVHQVRRKTNKVEIGLGVILHLKSSLLQTLASCEHQNSSTITYLTILPLQLPWERFNNHPSKAEMEIGYLWITVLCAPKPPPSPRRMFQRCSHLKITALAKSSHYIRYTNCNPFFCLPHKAKPTSLLFLQNNRL